MFVYGHLYQEQPGIRTKLIRFFADFNPEEYRPLFYGLEFRKCGKYVQICLLILLAAPYGRRFPWFKPIARDQVFARIQKTSILKEEA